MKWEVEQKFRVVDASAVESKLAEFGIEFAAAEEQIDHYFNHPARDFCQTDEALRIRQVGVDNFITYKGPKIDPATKTRHELELPLPSGSSTFQEFAGLLTALGFCSVGTVKKTRRPGHLVWEGHRVEVAVDEVERVGSFVELEIAASDITLDVAKTALLSLAMRLNLGSSERHSYLELLLRCSP